MDDVVPPADIFMPDLVNDDGFPVYCSERFGDFVEETGEEDAPRLIFDGGDDDFEWPEEGVEKVQRLALTRNSFMLYCGRTLAPDLIPEADGTCGKNDCENGGCDECAGVSCPACRTTASAPSTRIEILRRVFPALTQFHEDAISGVLRRHHGDIVAAADYIQGNLFQGLKLSMALSARSTTIAPPQLSENVRQQVQHLQETLQVAEDEAEYALRHNEYNAEQAAEYLLDELSTVRDLILSEKQKKQEMVKEAKRWNEQRREAILNAYTKSTNATLPDAESFPSLWNDRTRVMPPMIEVRGHRMIVAIEAHYCVLCVGPVPSRIGGLYYCQACGLCEGCIQTAFGNAPVVLRCPARANGGHLHHHPLKFTGIPSHCIICDMANLPVEANLCLSSPAIWSCSSCSMDFCPYCISHPVPDGFNRRLCSIVKTEEVHEAAATLEEPDELREYFSSMGVLRDENGGVAAVEQEFHLPLPPRSLTRQTTATAEREVARAWEGEVSQDVLVVLGTGTVGDEERVTVPQRTNRNTTRQAIPTPLTTAEGVLLGASQEALDNFQSDVSTVAAADVTYAEDLLRRAQAAPNNLTGEAIHNAIASGRLSIAGALLLSQAYAPTSSTADSAQHDENSSDDVTCWCGDIIDTKSSPDGAVGCLGGHAMHPSCAADLLLGGGRCPTCRQPLFYSRIAGSEIQVAAKFAKQEILRIHDEERQRVKTQLEELTKQGTKLSFNVGDIVLISPDNDFCRKAQLEDPIVGGWEEDMSRSCGREGVTTEIVSGEEGETVSVKVHTLGRHSYTQLIREFRCPTCSSLTEDYTGRHKCRYCNYCDRCCRRTLRACPHSTSDWFWSPSALTLVRRQGALSLAHETVFESEASAAVGRVERHILRLKCELIAVKKAREAVKAESERNIATLGLPKVGRGLSIGSNTAIVDMVASGVSAADWQRARHLLVMARQWGNSEEAKSRRAGLYSSVRSGDLDSVARLVRSYNVVRTVEALKWTDATSTSMEYIVAPYAQADLRAFPRFNSPKTGFSLGPLSRFRSKLEILDDNGLIWLHVFCPPIAERASMDVAPLTPSNAKIGARVRFKDGTPGVLTSVTRIDEGTQLHVTVGLRDGTNVSTSEIREIDYVFNGTPPPPPQGWLCSRPGGAGSRAIVSAAETKLRCFGCGDRMNSHEYESIRYDVAKGEKVQKGDTLLVAATLEAVVVESTEAGYVLCSFSATSTIKVDEGMKGYSEDCSVWYRPEDLVLPTSEARSVCDDDDTVSIGGKEMTRRELFLKCDRDDLLAKNMWNEAKRDGNAEDMIEAGRRFASCAKGHVLHARCLQGALVAGRCCPAPGCREPLWVPTVTRTRNDGNACCGSTPRNVQAQTEALQAASELPGHEAIVAVREAEGLEETNDLRQAGFDSLKMCPLCCSGPLFNGECSDMAAHHGQCSVNALRFGSENDCTPTGPFRVAASEIAARVAQMSANETVLDILPKCETHNALVIFNGCMVCGHLFTDTSWTDLPNWDSSAKALLELDKKTRHAARLLSEQVRTEAALLQFERDALWEASGEGVIDVNGEFGWGGSSLDNTIEPPPMPPPSMLLEVVVDQPGDY